MNKNKYIAACLAIALCTSLFVSCDDELEFDPQSFATSENFYKSTEEVNLAVVATYSSLYEVLDSEWNVTELRSDNTRFDIENRSEGSDSNRFTLDQNTMVSTNPLIADYYRACYSTVALANRVLENLDIVENDSIRAQYEGEARFLRAHVYFNLVRLFGSVPLITKVIDNTNVEDRPEDRSPESDVYDLIIEDLRFGYEDNLPDNFREDNIEELGRATKWSAGGLLGKVYLTTEQYELAETVLEDVRDNSGAMLLPNYSDVFSIRNEYSKEILFAVRYQSGGLGIGSPFANYFGPRRSGNNVITGDGESWNYPADELIEAFDVVEDSVRKNTSLAESYENLITNRTVTISYITKYNSRFTFEGDAGNDWPILRYSDVLLMLSEVYIRTKGTAEALALVNQVRTRALGVDGTIDNAPDNTIEFISDILLPERRLEFAFENQRWFDLVRTNNAIERINAHYNAETAYAADDDPAPQPIEDFQLLLPIPQYEIDLNPNFAQNIGY